MLYVCERRTRHVSNNKNNNNYLQSCLNFKYNHSFKRIQIADATSINPILTSLISRLAFWHCDKDSQWQVKYQNILTSIWNTINKTFFQILYISQNFIPHI